MLIRTTECTFYCSDKQGLNELLKHWTQQKVLGPFDHIVTANAVLTYTSKCHFHELHCCIVDCWESNTTGRGENEKCVCTRLNVRWGLLPPILILTKSQDLFPALQFFLLCDCAVLCYQKGWRLLTSIEYIPNRLGWFYLQFEHFWFGAWGNKVLIKRHEGGVKTETKINPNRSEVLTMTFFKSWSMYFFVGDRG